LFRSRTWWKIAALLALYTMLQPIEYASQGSNDLARWWEGPIHYIAEKSEVKTFRGLGSDEDRALYVERFWARRDPTPGTITNEYRQLFWERVRDANDLFLDSHREGWRTDRGKIYVLYGPPTTIEDYIHLKSGGNMSTSPGILRWLYEGRPGGRTDVNPIVVVAFERKGNEYKLSIDPKLNSVFFDQLAIEEETPSQRIAERMFSTPKHSELSVMLDLGKMQEVPPQAQVILERVETIEAYRTRPVVAEVDRYSHPRRPGTIAVVTVDVTDDTPEVNPAIIARFAPHDATLETRLLGEDSFRFQPSEGRRLAQGRLLLDPGTYDVTIMVVDPMTALPGMARETIRTSDASEQMRFSDILWARELEPLRYSGLASHDEPFQVGPFRVVPRLDDAFCPGDVLRLFYEIYGGAAPYRITYTLEGLKAEDEWTALGRPSERVQQVAAQGWTLPTTDAWPVGAYRISIHVEDAEARSMTAQMPFSLETSEVEASE
jgi:GWxTD domain-containing protein